VRTWFRFIHFHKLTGSTAETFLEYVQRNLPEGVALKVTKVSYFHLDEFKLILITNILKILQVLLENIPESVSSHTTSKIA